LTEALAEKVWEIIMKYKFPEEWDQLKADAEKWFIKEMGISEQPRHEANNGLEANPYKNSSRSIRSDTINIDKNGDGEPDISLDTDTGEAEVSQ
jgi:hypothetical protein